MEARMPHLSCRLMTVLLVGRAWKLRGNLEEIPDETREKQARNMLMGILSVPPDLLQREMQENIAFWKQSSLTEGYLPSDYISHVVSPSS